MKTQMIRTISWMILLSATPGLAADLKGPYLGQKPPGPVPQVFAPGIISVEGTTERSLALSPKGDELFFTRSSGWPYSKIMHMKKQGDTWSKPEPAAFLKDDGATQPVFSTDGQYLYFSTNHGKLDIRYFSLCRSKKEGDVWSETESVIDMGGGLMMEFHPSVARNGSVYFLYWDFLKEPAQLGDLYIARLIDGKYTDPVILRPPISTEYNEVRPTVDPDERYLLFESNRPGGFGGTDIYIAFRNSDETWSAPKNLGPTVNTPGIDDTPNISPDGRYWFFSKNGDIYWRETPTALLERSSSGNEKATVPARQSIPYGTNDAAGHRIRVGDAEIYYEVYGDGPPLLLLHGGFYGYIDGWTQYIPVLSKQFRVIAMATRGHGKSSIGSQPFSRRLFAEDAAAVLKRETDQPAVVVGSSDGANTTYMLAAVHPDLIKKVVAIGNGLWRTQLTIEWAKNLPEEIEQQLGGFVTARKQLMPEPERWNEFVEKCRAMYMAMDGVSDEQARSITCPVLIIGGDRDQFIPLNEFVRARSLIRNSRLLILPDCDHSSAKRRPVVLREFVLPFVQEQR